MGGSPTRSVEAARERRPRDPGLGGQAGDRPLTGRVVVDEPQGLADDGIALGAVPAGSVRAREPDAQDGDQHPVEQPVEHGLLARVVLDDLRDRSPTSGDSHASRATTSSDGSAFSRHRLTSPSSA
jgi:hypothetical protein